MDCNDEIVEENRYGIADVITSKKGLYAKVYDKDNNLIAEPHVYHVNPDDDIVIPIKGDPAELKMKLRSILDLTCNATKDRS